MVDLIKIYLKAGKGGDGRISFHSNRYQLKGGPDGGNGGQGGSIVLVADRNHHSLRDFAGKPEIEAQDGQMGGKAKMFGANSEDVVLHVPMGTAVWRVNEDFVPKEPKKMYSYDEDGTRKEWELQRRRRNLSPDLKTVPKVLPLKEEKELVKFFRVNGENKEAKLVGEVLEDGQVLRVVAGGRGGRGNFEFRSSTHTTPWEAETGQGGEEGVFFLELKVLADLGFVGFPNAGKSTLLSVLTKAQPQIASYPFTTLEPNLGILDFPSHKEGEKANYVIADIPGIIEGASQGKGLGVAFLRHIERCRVLLFVLALEDYDVLQFADDVPLLVEKLTQQYQELVNELESYEKKFAGELEGPLHISRKKRLVVINKSDLYPQELQDAIASEAGKTLSYPLFISAKTNENIDKLKSNLREVLS